MKIVYSGLESSGKSLKLAMTTCDVAWRNKKWKEEQIKFMEEKGVEEFEKFYGRKDIYVRPIVSNLIFKKDFYDLVTVDYGIPIIYWEKLEELVEYENCDVIWDELGNYLDATKWAMLSSDVKKWLTQGAKVGIEIYGSSQDFGQVDKAFRRLTNHLFHITKVIGSPRPANTKPPVKNIWGLCLVTEMEAKSYKEDQPQIKGNVQIPDFFFIEKKYCNIFDTTQKIKKENTLYLRHIKVYCSDPNCTYHTIKHI